MEYKDFLEEVKNNIKDYLPDSFKDATVQIQKTIKNNGLSLDGLSVSKVGQMVSPVMYLNHHYENLQRGVTNIDQICKNVADGILNNQKSFDLKEILDPKQIKDKITFSVIGAEKNAAMLLKMPHRIKDDLAMVYRIIVNQENQEVGSVKISDQLAESLNLNEKDLYNMAMENTPKLFPAQFQSMFDVLKKMMPEMAEMMEPNIFEDSMYVLSNEQNIDGASALFYPGVQEEIYKHMGKEYYVLPSSIHETIIVPKNASMNATELKNMVMEINGKEVSPDEVLTDSVYEYDARSKTLTIANDERYRVNTKDIVKAGFKPTKTLVKSMESLNKSVGRNCSLKDVKELAQDAKASTITKDIAKDIVKECQVQEMTMDLPTR